MKVLGALDDKIAADFGTASKLRKLSNLEWTNALARAGSHLKRPTVGELMAEGALAFSDGYRTRADQLGSSGFRIVRVADIEQGFISVDNPDFVRSEYLAQIGQKLGYPGDVLVTTKGTIGRVAVVLDVAEPIVYSPQICFFRPRADSWLTSAYLATWLRSEDFSRQAAFRMHKTDMAPYINLADIRSLEVPSIEDPERDVLLRRLDLNEKLSQTTQRESVHLAALRDTLLPALMSGKLRVKDAERVVEDVL